MRILMIASLILFAFSSYETTASLAAARNLGAAEAALPNIPSAAKVMRLGPIALKDLTLDRAFRVPLTIQGTTPLAALMPSSQGLAITEITFVPGDGYAANANGANSNVPRFQVPVSVNGMVVAQPDMGFPAPRTHQFDPPVIAKPGEVLSLSLVSSLSSTPNQYTT